MEALKILRGFLLWLFLTGMLLAGVYFSENNASMCPLRKQGCDCGTICNKHFDCIRGKHE